MLTLFHGSAIVNVIHEGGDNVVNTEMLTSAIKDSGLKNVYIASQMGISTQSLQRKVDGDTEFKASEIVRMTSILKLSKSQRDQIFLQ